MTIQSGMSRLLHPISWREPQERFSTGMFPVLTGLTGYLFLPVPGNNGGDGLALARMLSANRYDVEVHYVQFTDKTSPDWDENRLRLQAETDVRLNYLDSPDKFPVISLRRYYSRCNFWIRTHTSCRRIAGRDNQRDKQG